MGVGVCGGVWDLGFGVWGRGGRSPSKDFVGVSPDTMGSGDTVRQRTAVGGGQWGQGGHSGVGGGAVRGLMGSYGVM